MEIKAVDVAKLRKMTGAGMMDCKKALVDAEGDFERAKEIIKEKGKLVAAKRADRETSEGAAIAKINGNKAIIVALGCETDFVAKNAEFQALADAIAEAAIANFPADKEALMACTIADGRTVEAAITEQTGKTGEKHQHLVAIFLECVRIVHDVLVYSLECAECISREQCTLLCKPCDHGLRPVDHRDHMEGKVAAAEAYLAAFSNDCDPVFRCSIISLEHRNRLGIRNNLHLRIFLQHVCYE